MLHRLIVSPDAKPGYFTGHLNNIAFKASRQPLVDAARVLLAVGHGADEQLTMRHRDKTFDSFAPLPLGRLAEVTYTEGEKTTLRSGRWMPFAGVR